MKGAARPAMEEGFSVWQRRIVLRSTYPGDRHQDKSAARQFFVFLTLQCVLICDQCHNSKYEVT
jgi:hypothetical protein